MSQKIGIIGAGGMARYHIEGFRKAGAQIIAFADPVLASAERACKQYEVPHAYDSPKAMFAAHPDITAVSVITPNRFHAALAIESLKAGKHVFCEKPPALSAAEAKRMQAAAKAAKRQLMFNFNNRARPESRAMCEYIRQGAVGTINSAQAKWIRRTGIPGFGGWFTNKALSGGGPLIDLPHMLDLALYFMDYPQPEWVLAQTFSDFITDKQFKGPWGIPDNAQGVTDVENAAHGFIRFKMGQVLSFQISWAELVKREEVSVAFQGTNAGGLVQRLFGTDGIDATSIDTCELYTQENGRSVDRTIKVPADETMGRVACAQNFIETLEGKAAPLTHIDQAVKLMQILDAAYRSAQSGKPVQIK